MRAAAAALPAADVWTEEDVLTYNGEEDDFADDIDPESESASEWDGEDDS